MQNELNHLIKMVNQIAAHCAPGEPSDVAADKAASHLQRFWAPSMKTKSSTTLVMTAVPSAKLPRMRFSGLVEDLRVLKQSLNVAVIAESYSIGCR